MGFWNHLKFSRSPSNCFILNFVPGYRSSQRLLSRQSWKHQHYLNIDKSLCEWLEKFLTQFVEETAGFVSNSCRTEVVRITGLFLQILNIKSVWVSLTTDQSDFFLLLFGLKRSAVAAPELASFLLLAFLARDLAPPFVLFVLHNGQCHTSGIAVLFTFAQARWTQVAQELHSIMGRPA